MYDDSITRRLKHSEASCSQYYLNGDKIQRLILIFGMRCPRDQARTDSARNPSGPSQVGQGSSSANQIPLVVLQQSFVQNSCTESSNLSSSQSPSTTPPSSAGRPSSQEEELGAWPSSANCNLGATPPEPSPPFSTTDRRAETAPITFAPESVPSEDDGNQPTQASQEQHSSAGPGISWSTLNRWVSERSWFHSTLGITSLMLTTISVFVYGLRSYEMARWSERNDLLQMCAGLIQVLPVNCQGRAYADDYLGQRYWRSRLREGTPRGPNITSLFSPPKKIFSSGFL